MLEQQRIEYLQAMGIQLWMPRYALENAAESSWLADSCEKETVSETGGHVLVKAGHAADLLIGMGLAETAKPEVLKSINESAVEEEPHPKKISLGSPAPAPVVSGEQTGEAGTAISDAPVDLSVPTFELHFALWPCGILWVSSCPFEQRDHGFQMSVSYSLLGSTAPQATYSQFKWPYIEGSDEDQTMPVALRALTAQWDFMSNQGARGWIAMDSASQFWLEKVASSVLFAVNERSDLYRVSAKKQLWQALKTLPKESVS